MKSKPKTIAILLLSVFALLVGALAARADEDTTTRRNQATVTNLNIQ